jgi:hypothetical protein
VTKRSARARRDDERRAKITTHSDATSARPTDLVDRQFAATRPNQLWVADFTYVATWRGFVILLAVLTLIFLLVVVTLQPFAYLRRDGDSNPRVDMIALVEGAERQKTPNEIALNIDGRDQRADRGWDQAHEQGAWIGWSSTTCSPRQAALSKRLETSTRCLMMRPRSPRPTSVWP